MSKLQFFSNSNRRGARMAQAVCALLAASLGLFACSAPGAVPLTVGTNVNITANQTGNTFNETITINPVNPKNIFASEYFGYKSKYSTNGGAAWINSDMSAFPNLGGNGDTSAAFDMFGNLFMARNDTTSGGVMIGISTNGGATFTLLYQTANLNTDTPNIATGPSPTTGGQSVWVVFTDTSTVEITAQGAPVNGLGNVGAFGPEQTVAGSFGDYGDAVVGPNGQLMVAYQDPFTGEGPDTILISVDPDGLGPMGFGPEIAATGTQIGSVAIIPAQPNLGVDSEAGIVWDNSGGPHNGRVYLMYTDRPSTVSYDMDIYVRYSDNAGATWSPRVRVNDDTLGNGKSQFNPKIALDQTSGLIAVSFYDTRNSPPNSRAELWASISDDGGLTFSPNVKVSAGVSDANASLAGGFDFGYYVGLAFQSGAFYPCWADNSDSTGDNPNGPLSQMAMYTAKVRIGGPPVIAGIQPTNIVILMGQPALFTATATGSTPLSFQWLQNGVSVPSTLSNIYFLPSAQPGNSGNYSVIVTNAFGAATSSVVKLTVIPTVPLPFALNDSLTWTVDPVSPWYGQTNISHDGVAAAQTFFLADASQTSLRTTVNGPGTLKFWWKVSSQTNADFLSFSINGAAQAQISGEAGWLARTNFLPAGTQNLQWTYAKNASGSNGLDAAWLDQAIYTLGGTPPFILTQPANVTTWPTCAGRSSLQ